MPLSSRLVVVVLFSALAASSSSAQLFTDQGTMSGSGLMMLPTATTAPSAEMQAQFTRISFLQNTSNRLNVFSLNCGFSPDVEGYVRLSSEEIQTISSQIAYGFGGKIRFPSSLPVVRRLALWVESTTSETSDPAQRTIFPARANRAAFTASLDSNGFHPSFVVGVNNVSSTVVPMVGGGLTWALGHKAQLGMEWMQGYLGKSTNQVIVTGSIRVLPYVSVHMSPGYVSTPLVNAAMISVGLSFSTVDIDYHQVKDKSEEREENVLPSIDDLEKQSGQDKK